MEQSESLTKIVGKIKALEEQLSLCASINKECDLSAAKAEEEIEHHFERCMHTLAARKAILLKELAHKVTIQSMLYISLPITIIFFHILHIFS